MPFQMNSETFCNSSDVTSRKKGGVLQSQLDITDHEMRMRVDYVLRIKTCQVSY